ncbi:MAG TPA: pyruvate formate lyase family protein [Myxococcota bacterium]|nr:pyruvate formate lyase family protein [Myxococcota bacterium]
MRAEDLSPTERVLALHRQVLETSHALCAERALLVTRYHRQRDNRRQPAVLRSAGALAYVLRGKAVRIYPQELLVGNFTSHRVGGGLFSELHGVAVLEDRQRRCCRRRALRRCPSS